MYLVEKLYSNMYVTSVPVNALAGRYVDFDLYDADTMQSIQISNKILSENDFFPKFSMRDFNCILCLDHRCIDFQNDIQFNGICSVKELVAWKEQYFFFDNITRNDLVVFSEEFKNCADIRFLLFEALINSIQNASYFIKDDLFLVRIWEKCDYATYYHSTSAFSFKLKPSINAKKAKIILGVV